MQGAISQRSLNGRPVDGFITTSVGLDAFRFHRLSNAFDSLPGVHKRYKAMAFLHCTDPSEDFLHRSLAVPAQVRPFHVQDSP